MAELDRAVRDYLGWSHVLSRRPSWTYPEPEEPGQRASEAGRPDRHARLLAAYQWALVPEQPDPARHS